MSFNYEDQEKPKFERYQVLIDKFIPFPADRSFEVAKAILQDFENQGKVGVHIQGFDGQNWVELDREGHPLPNSD